MIKRNYSSAVREEQAARTRRTIGRVAAELFVSQGYAATSMAQIARQSGVTAQTVYNSFATKAALLKAAYDMTLVGDDEPVPLAQRPDVQALYAQTDPAAFLQGYADLGRTIVERVGPLLQQVSAGAVTGDPALVDMRDTTDRERKAGVGMVAARVAELGGLRSGLTQDEARDRIWILNSFEVWNLTARLGWTSESTAEWIGAAMCEAVLEPGYGERTSL